MWLKKAPLYTWPRRLSNKFSFSVNYWHSAQKRYEKVQIFCIMYFYFYIIYFDFLNETCIFPLFASAWSSNFWQENEVMRSWLFFSTNLPLEHKSSFLVPWMGAFILNVPPIGVTSLPNSMKSFSSPKKVFHSVNKAWSAHFQARNPMIKGKLLEFCNASLGVGLPLSVHNTVLFGASFSID